MLWQAVKAQGSEGEITAEKKATKQHELRMAPEEWRVPGSFVVVH